MPRKREVKDPMVRKQEILDTAMNLFTRQGYEETSMRDIAKEMNVSLGLCYRYFDSKQILFQEAMNHYVEKCCQLFISVLQNNDLDFFQKIDQLFEILSQEKTIYEYHDFFHQPQNLSLHEELSMRICQYMIPYIIEESQKYCESHHLHIDNLESFIRFMVYGQVGLVSHQNMPNFEMIKCLKHYFQILLEHELIPD